MGSTLTLQAAFFLLRQLTVCEIVKPIEQAPIHQFLEEIALRAGRKVLMEVDLNITDCW
jgi:hypothetical protein